MILEKLLRNSSRQESLVLLGLQLREVHLLPRDVLELGDDAREGVVVRRGVDAGPVREEGGGGAEVAEGRANEFTWLTSLVSLLDRS
jgi:hypothetical protein